MSDTDAIARLEQAIEKMDGRLRRLESSVDGGAARHVNAGILELRRRLAAELMRRTVGTEVFYSMTRRSTESSLSALFGASKRLYTEDERLCAMTGYIQCLDRDDSWWLEREEWQIKDWISLFLRIGRKARRKS